MTKKLFTNAKAIHDERNARIHHIDMLPYWIVGVSPEGDTRLALDRGFMTLIAASNKAKSLDLITNEKLEIWEQTPYEWLRIMEVDE